MEKKTTAGRILLLHGPNLNMLGRRDPAQYGTFTLQDVVDLVTKTAARYDLEVTSFWSNHEGDLIDRIQQTAEQHTAILINAGALTHTSYALRDALELSGLPVVEVHISDIHSREQFRHVSVIRAVCIGQIAGQGLSGYSQAVKMLAQHLQSERAQQADLKTLRVSLDQVDKRMLSLLQERLELARSVAAFKLESGQPVLDQSREDSHLAELLQDYCEKDKNQATSLLKNLMRLSRTTQYESLIQAGRTFDLYDLLTAEPKELAVTKVAIQGAAGSYAEQAGLTMFARAGQLNAATVEQACDLVSHGQADVAVLPFENSTAGTVDAVYDALLRHDLAIWRSLSLPISHQLLAAPGAKLEQIRTVISHPQALAQCLGFIKQHGFQEQVSLNTAFAAEQVAKQGDKSVAAIASAAAAGQYGLIKLAEDINDNRQNRTRFIAVGKEFKATADADKISLIVKLPHTVGALAQMSAVFSDSGLNLSKIQSRPDVDNPWQYLFYLDFQVQRKDLAMALPVLYLLSREMPFVRLLGWYKEMELTG